MSIVAIAACLALLGIELPAEDGQVQPAACQLSDPIAIGVQQAVAQSIRMKPSSGADCVDAASSISVTPLQQKVREVEQLKSEIKLLRGGLGANPQILVRVEMLDVSLTKLQALFNKKSDGQSYRSLGVDRFAELQKSLKTGPAFGQPYTLPSISGKSDFLELMKHSNVAKVLAEPNIVVVSGRPASFFEGGEIPMPSRPDSNAAVEFQKLGTEVDLLAVARDEKHVRLELRARVSERDYSRSQKINGMDIPALTVRQCDTAVEATFGEPVVLNGIVETRFDDVKTNAGVVTKANEIMLMVIATPALVEPIDVSVSEPVSPAMRTQ